MKAIKEIAIKFFRRISNIGYVVNKEHFELLNYMLRNGEFKPNAKFTLDILDEKLTKAELHYWAYKYITSDRPKAELKYVGSIVELVYFNRSKLSYESHVKYFSTDTEAKLFYQNVKNLINNSKYLLPSFRTNDELLHYDEQEIQISSEETITIFVTSPDKVLDRLISILKDYGTGYNTLFEGYMNGNFLKINICGFDDPCQVLSDYCSVKVDINYKKGDFWIDFDENIIVKRSNPNLIEIKKYFFY